MARTGNKEFVVTMSGSTLASLLFDGNNSPRDSEGLLIGHCLETSQQHVTDAEEEGTKQTTYLKIDCAVKTGCPPSFYDSKRRINKDILESWRGQVASRFDTLNTGKTARILGWWSFARNIPGEINQMKKKVPVLTRYAHKKLAETVSELESVDDHGPKDLPLIFIQVLTKDASTVMPVLETEYQVFLGKSLEMVGLEVQTMSHTGHSDYKQEPSELCISQSWFTPQSSKSEVQASSSSRSTRTTHASGSTKGARAPTPGSAEDAMGPPANPQVEYVNMLAEKLARAMESEVAEILRFQERRKNAQVPPEIADLTVLDQNPENYREAFEAELALRDDVSEGGESKPDVVAMDAEDVTDDANVTSRRLRSKIDDFVTDGNTNIEKELADMNMAAGSSNSARELDFGGSQSPDLFRQSSSREGSANPSSRYMDATSIGSDTTTTRTGTNAYPSQGAHHLTDEEFARQLQEEYDKEREFPPLGASSSSTSATITGRATINSQQALAPLPSTGYTSQFGFVGGQSSGWNSKTDGTTTTDAFDFDEDENRETEKYKRLAARKGKIALSLQEVADVVATYDDDDDDPDYDPNSSSQKGTKAARGRTSNRSNSRAGSKQQGFDRGGYDQNVAERNAGSKRQRSPRGGTRDSKTSSKPSQEKQEGMIMAEIGSQKMDQLMDASWATINQGLDMDNETLCVQETDGTEHDVTDLTGDVTGLDCNPVTSTSMSFNHPDFAHGERALASKNIDHQSREHVSSTLLLQTGSSPSHASGPSGATKRGREPNSGGSSSNASDENNVTDVHTASGSSSGGPAPKDLLASPGAIASKACRPPLKKGRSDSPGYQDPPASPLASWGRGKQPPAACGSFRGRIPGSNDNLSDIPRGRGSPSGSVSPPGIQNGVSTSVRRPGGPVDSLQQEPQSLADLGKARGKKPREETGRTVVDAGLSGSALALKATTRNNAGMGRGCGANKPPCCKFEP